jgi:transposase
METVTCVAERTRSGEQVAVGVDPSRGSLQLAILAPHGTVEKRIRPTPASLDSVDELLGDGQVEIGVEGSCTLGPLVLLRWLRRGYDVREVNFQVSKRMRECLTEAHTDRTDAVGMAWTLKVHPRLPEVRMTPQTAAWKRLVQARDKLVRHRTALYNRLHALLSESYGGLYKGLFRELTTKKALRFFQEFPTLNEVHAAPAAQIRTAVGKEQAKELRQAGAWEEDVYLEVLRMEIRRTIELILTYDQAVQEMERRLEKLSRGDAQVERLVALGGVGTVTALKILGYSGEFSRFAGKDAYAGYCGLAPAPWQSGRGRERGKRRRRYHRGLKATFVQVALTWIRDDAESRAYYDRKRGEGKTHYEALKRLARIAAHRVYNAMAPGVPSAKPTPVDIEG